MSEKSVLEILVEARASIANPATWTRGCYARNRYGARVSPLSDEAVSFCSIGALDRALRSNTALGDPVMRALRAGSGVLDISAFNDGRTHAEVIAVFDAAITAERAKLVDLTPQVHAIIDSALTAAADPVQRERVLQHGSV